MIPTIDKEKTGKNLKKLMERKHITPMDMMEYLNLACVQTVHYSNRMRRMLME